MKKIFLILSYVFITIVISSACGEDNGSKTEGNSSTKNALKSNSDTLKQAPTEETKKAFIQVFTSSGIVFDQPCQSKIILCVESGVARAIHVNCEDEYALFNYLGGEADGLTYSGKGSFFDNCGGSDPEKTMCKSTKPFKMELDKDSSKLKFNGTKYAQSNSKLSFKTKGMKLYESPDSKSELIEQIADTKAKVELLGIGELQKKGTEWGIWYRVKVNEQEGWCLDCLNF